MESRFGTYVRLTLAAARIQVVGESIRCLPMTARDAIVSSERMPKDAMALRSRVERLRYNPSPKFAIAHAFNQGVVGYAYIPRGDQLAFESVDCLG